MHKRLAYIIGRHTFTVVLFSEDATMPPYSILSSLFICLSLRNLYIRGFSWAPDQNIYHDVAQLPKSKLCFQTEISIDSNFGILELLLSLLSFPYSCPFNYYMVIFYLLNIINIHFALSIHTPTNIWVSVKASWYFYGLGLTSFQSLRMLLEWSL